MKYKNGIYVVMADNGVGEFLWFKDNDQPIPVCGANVYSLMDKNDPDPIMSKELFNDFCNWAETYLASTVVNDDADIDWISFNKIGMELAKRLKMELGHNARVRYVKPPEDPSHIRFEFKEIM